MRQHPIRVLLGIVVIGVVMLASGVTVPAGAQQSEPSTGDSSTDSGITVTAVPRWGRSTPGVWTTYLVTVRNDGRGDVDGEVVLSPEKQRRPGQAVVDTVRTGSSARPQVLALGQREMTVVANPVPARASDDFPVHRASLDLAAGGTEKRVTMVLVEAPFGYRAEVRDRSGATIAVAEPVPGPQPTHTVAIMSRVAGARDSLGRLRDFFDVPSLNENVVATTDSLAVISMATAADVPDSAVGFSGLDALVIDDFDTASLTPGQVRAVRDYVALGGSLILGGSAAGTRALSALPPELVPMVASGPSASATAAVSMAVLGDLVGRPTSATAPVLTGEVRRGRVLLETGDGVPLVVQAEHRGGRVVQLAYDPLEEPFASDPELADLAWQQGISRALYGLRRGDGQRVGVGPGVAPLEQLWSVPAAAARSTGEGWAPWPRSGIWLLVLYGVAVIPVGWCLLRVGRRSRLVWAAAPVAALVFAAVAGMGGESRLYRGQPALAVTTVGVGGTAMTNTYEALRGLGRGRSHVDADTGAVSTLFTMPNLTATSPQLGLGGTGGGEVDQGRGTDLTLRTVPGEFRDVQVLSVGEEPGLESSLRLVGTEPPEEGGLRVVGTIANRSSRALRKLRVQTAEGAQAQVADVVGAGETLAVDARFVWPANLEAGTGIEVGLDEQVMFAAADQAFTRSGQAVVVGLDEGGGGGRRGGGRGGGGINVVLEVVPLEAAESLVAGTGTAHPVASVRGVEYKVAFELDALRGLGPVDLSYSTAEFPPDVYDWTTRTWRALPPGVQVGAPSDTAPLHPTEVRDGVVRVRAFVGRFTSFGLAARRP